MAELTPAQEAQLQAAFRRAYNVWLPQVEAAVLGGYDRFGMAPDPAAINATVSTWRAQIEQVESQELAEVARVSYEEEDPGHGGEALSNVLVTAAAAATLLFLLAQVGEIQGQLIGLIGGATSSAEAAARIRQFLSPANTHWAAKAAQMAATEGDRWVQAATLAAAMAAQKRDGVARDKIWITRDDDRVRTAHEMTDGQRRALSARFDVAGFPMLYPKDPAAPPELVVNCRCHMRIVKRGE